MNAVRQSDAALVAAMDAALAERPRMPMPRVPDGAPAASASAIAAPVAEEERLPWPEEWFVSGDPAHGAACRRLWSEALHALLREIVTGRACGLKSSISDPCDVNWLGSRDFFTVCALAGFDGQAIRQRVLSALRTPEGRAELGHIFDRHKAPPGDV